MALYFKLIYKHVVKNKMLVLILNQYNEEGESEGEMVDIYLTFVR